MFGYRLLSSSVYQGGGGGSLPPTGLLHAWNFNSNFEDQVGDADLEDSSSSVSFTPGKIGNCIVMNGSNSLYRAIIPGGDVNFSFYIWVKLAIKDFIDTAIAGKIEPGDQRLEWQVYYSGGLDRFVFETVYTSSSGDISQITANTFGSPDVGVWYLIKVFNDAENDSIGIAVNNGTPDILTGVNPTFDNIDCKLGVGILNIGLAPDGTQFDAAAYYNQVNDEAIDDLIWNDGDGAEI